jgi:hypothetical protein
MTGDHPPRPLFRRTRYSKDVADDFPDQGLLADSVVGVSLALDVRSDSVQALLNADGDLKFLGVEVLEDGALRLG